MSCEWGDVPMTWAGFELLNQRGVLLAGCVCVALTVLAACADTGFSISGVVVAGRFFAMLRREQRPET